MKKILGFAFFISGLIAKPALALETSKERLQNIGRIGQFASTTSPLGPKIIILNIIAYVLGLVGMLFLIMIIYSGYQWISAGGNEEMIDKAKTRLKNAVIGLGITIAAYAITTWIFNAIQTVSVVSIK